MLAQVAAARSDIEQLGFIVAGIGPAAHYQAQVLEPRLGFPLFVDPQRRTYERVHIGRQSLLRYLLNLPAWWRWLRAFVRRRRQYRITGHYSTLPGVVVTAPGGAVTWLHRGTGLGDYPPLTDVLRRLEGNNS